MSKESGTYGFEESGAFVDIFAIEPTSSGPLSGLTFAVKDLIDIAGHKTGCGNPDWRKTHPVAAANGVCVDQLLHAGGRFAGKTITDELAFSLNGENHFYGTPLNPRAPDRVPGGSSSGSASAVSCGLVDFALGTDTGGSVRVPAGNCGIFGLRPSHGVISVAGVMPFAPTFDTVGVLARSSEVLTKAATVLTGREPPGDVTVGNVHLIREALEICDPDVSTALEQPLDRLKDLFTRSVKETSMREVDGEPLGTALEVWYHTYCTVQWAEIWSCLGGWIENVKPEFGPRIKVNFEHVKNLDRSGVGGGIRKREFLAANLENLLGANDLICIPTAPALAPIKGSLGNDRTSGDYYPRTLSLTAIAGIGRLPQVSLPVAEAGGVPVGLSLLAREGADAFLLAAVRQVVRRLGIG
jgi:amidase